MRPSKNSVSVIIRIAYENVKLLAEHVEHVPHPLGIALPMDASLDEHIFRQLARSSPFASDTLRLWEPGPNEK